MTCCLRSVVMLIDCGLLTVVCCRTVIIWFVVCWLSAGCYWLLCVVWCVLGVACGLLIVDRWSLFAVRCLLRVACLLLVV